MIGMFGATALTSARAMMEAGEIQVARQQEQERD